MFTYEVYVYERSRWILESSFPAEGRRDALKLARRIEAHQSSDGVQVIREKVHPDTGSVERTTGLQHVAPTQGEGMARGAR